MGCTGSSFVLEGVEIDLDAAPSADDNKLHEEISKTLNECAKILETLKSYKSCADECRKALGEPTPKNRWLALDSVTKTVKDVHLYFRHGDKISSIVIEIIKILVKDIQPNLSRIDPIRDIKFNDHSALVMQLALTLSFIINFDNLKSLNAAIQNDLSMYRRMCQISRKMSAVDDEEEKEYLEKLQK